MRLELWHVGRTKVKWIRTGETQYIQKCKRFTTIDETILPVAKSKSPKQAKSEECTQILSRLKKSPKIYTVLLDERGKMRSSVDFAKHLEKTFMNRGSSIRFITGGPFGVSDEVRAACDEIIAVSPMIFPHELIRVILLEQLYRAFTILRGESYHHV